MWASCTRCRSGDDKPFFNDCKALSFIPCNKHSSFNPVMCGQIVSHARLPVEYTIDANWQTADIEKPYPAEVKESPADDQKVCVVLSTLQVND